MTEIKDPALKAWCDGVKAGSAALERERIVEWLKARAVRIHDELTRIPMKRHYVNEHRVLAAGLEAAAADLEAGKEP